MALSSALRAARLRVNLAVDLDGRREAGGDEEVGALLVDHLFQEAAAASS
jgi:hypothetical protein